MRLIQVRRRPTFVPSQPLVVDNAHTGTGIIMERIDAVMLAVEQR